MDKQANWWLTSIELGIMYKPVAKAACTSFMEYFLNEASIKTDKLSDNDIHNIVVNKIPLISDDCYLEVSRAFKLKTFSFVRNTYKRFISCYKNKVIGRNSAYGEQIYNTTKKTTLDEFINYTESFIDMATCDRHLRLQSVVIPDKIHFVGRVEYMEKDLSRLSKLIKHDINISHKNKSNVNIKLTNKQKNILYTIYKNDFDRFGYTK